MRNVRMQDGWTDGFHKGGADQLQKTWTLEDIWEGPSSMQVVDRTIAGRLLVQLDGGLGHQAGLVDPPGDGKVGDRITLPGEETWKPVDSGAFQKAWDKVIIVQMAESLRCLT